MANRFYIAGYWPARREEVDSCADRLVRFLDCLTDVSPLLGQWFEPGADSGSTTRPPIELTLNTLRAFLSAGRNRRDTDSSVISELGFSVSLWNGIETDAGLRVGCGRYGSTLGNAVVLNLPPPEGVGAELYSPSAALDIMRALVACWEPQWATMTSHMLRRAQSAKTGDIVVGWMTYVAQPQSVDKDRLPAGVMTQRLENGTLITIGSDVNRVSNDSVRAVREAI